MIVKETDSLQLDCFYAVVDACLFSFLFFLVCLIVCQFLEILTLASQSVTIFGFSSFFYHLCLLNNKHTVKIFVFYFFGPLTKATVLSCLSACFKSIKSILGERGVDYVLNDVERCNLQEFENSHIYGTLKSFPKTLNILSSIICFIW